MKRVLNILDTLQSIRPKMRKTNKKLDSQKEYKSDSSRSAERIHAAGPKVSEQSSKDPWSNLRETLNTCRGQRNPDICRDPAESGVLVNVLEAQRFVRDVFLSMDVPYKGANEIADALIAADYMGRRSMGIHRLPGIAADLLNLTVAASAQPKVLTERESLALVDGQNAPGPVVANYCMELAMNKARKQAIGYVVARRSNDIGMGLWYACQALPHRLIGLCMSNGPPILVPKGGVEPLLGSNSIACAAYGGKEQFVTDIGMSACSIEQLELEYCNAAAGKLHPSMALNCQGRPTSCVADALQAQRFRSFMPEHKGFGLAAMVDVLCGVMTGASYATKLQRRNYFNPNTDQADLGQIYVVIDPMHFSVSFEERLADFYRLLRNSMPSEDTQTPLIPGDMELQHMQMVDDVGGLMISACTLRVLKELSEFYNIEPIKSIKNTD